MDEQENSRYRGYIGVFDSGVGGISVLKELAHTLPEENFLYFGDSAYAPYGSRSEEEVYHLSKRIADGMMKDGVKAIVIACNTATSAAVARLRQEYPGFPIIGVEPAIKPAAKAFPGGNILVMATAVTLNLRKFKELMKKLEGSAQFYPVKCIGLVDLIEEGDLGNPRIKDLLGELLGQYKGKVDAVVLGCTHYPFVKEQIREILGPDIPMFDSALGTARELKRVLASRNLSNEGSKAIPEQADVKNAGGKAIQEQKQGDIVFGSSKDTPEEIGFYRKLFEVKIV